MPAASSATRRRTRCRAFQRERGLAPDGQLRRGHVEGAGRGDVEARRSPARPDVAEPARRRCRRAPGTLGRLGFDCGRVDGIFGPRTRTRTRRLPVELRDPWPTGCAAPRRCALLRRVSGHSGTGPGVASVREHDLLRHRSPRSRIAERRDRSVRRARCRSPVPSARELRRRGALVMSLDEPDPVAQADAANRFGADAYVGLDAGTRGTVRRPLLPSSRRSSPSVDGRSRPTSRAALADLRPRRRRPACGMRLPILRETRMPAVLCLLAPLRVGGRLAQSPSVAARSRPRCRSGRSSPSLNER